MRNPHDVPVATMIQTAGGAGRKRKASDELGSATSSSALTADSSAKRAAIASDALPTALATPPRPWRIIVAEREEDQHYGVPQYNQAEYLKPENPDGTISNFPHHTTNIAKGDHITDVERLNSKSLRITRLNLDTNGRYTQPRRNRGKMDILKKVPLKAVSPADRESVNQRNFTKDSTLYAPAYIVDEAIKKRSKVALRFLQPVSPRSQINEKNRGYGTTKPVARADSLSPDLYYSNDTPIVDSAPPAAYAVSSSSSSSAVPASPAASPVGLSILTPTTEVVKKMGRDPSRIKVRGKKGKKKSAKSDTKIGESAETNKLSATPVLPSSPPPAITNARLTPQPKVAVPGSNSSGVGNAHKRPTVKAGQVPPSFKDLNKLKPPLHGAISHASAASSATLPVGQRVVPPHPVTPAPFSRSTNKAHGAGVSTGGKMNSKTYTDIVQAARATHAACTKTVAAPGYIDVPKLSR